MDCMPPEIIMMILNKLAMKDILSFALSSKSHYNRAKTFLHGRILHTHLQTYEWMRVRRLSQVFEPFKDSDIIDPWIHDRIFLIEKKNPWTTRLGLG